MLRYNINSGVKKIKTKTAILASAIVLGISGGIFGLALPFAAHAQGAGDGSNASACGSGHGAFADVNGSFGQYVGHGGTPVYHDGAVGQDSGATGYNNSHTDCQG